MPPPSSRTGGGRLGVGGGSSAPPAATTKRLLKEWASIRAELEAAREAEVAAEIAHDEEEEDEEELDAAEDDELFASESQDGNRLLGSPATSSGQRGSSRRRGRRRDGGRDGLRASTVSRGGANPDLLELRPWDADGEDLYEWFAIIRGPQGGDYAGGCFELSIKVPPTYPTRPPTVSFRTKIWHPNVHWKICLDILSSNWSPAWTLSSTLTAIIALLDSPEPDSPLNVDAANLLRSGDRTAYRSLCRMWVGIHAATGGSAGAGQRIG